MGKSFRMFYHLESPVSSGNTNVALLSAALVDVHKVRTRRFLAPSFTKNIAMDPSSELV